MQIHPTAIVSPNAKIGQGTVIGPYCTVGEHVSIGEKCELQSHVVVDGRTTIGNAVRISPFAVIGTEPQHLKYKGEPTEVIIKDNCILRECVTVHRATEFGGGKTVVGENTYLMAYAHVAHDCLIGKNAIICNNVQLAGHVILEDHVTIGGASEVAQFCRVGQHCYVGGGSTLRKDLPPFLVGKDNEFKVQGINVVGLERQGFPAASIQKLKTLYKIFFIQKNTVAQAIEKAVTELGDSEEVKLFIAFIKSSKVGFHR